MTHTQSTLSTPMKTIKMHRYSQITVMLFVSLKTQIFLRAIGFGNGTESVRLILIA